MEDFSIERLSNVAVALDDPTLGNPFEKSYAPWPVRFFVLKRDVHSSHPTALQSSSNSSAHQATPPAEASAPKLVFVSSPKGGGYIELSSFQDAIMYHAAIAMAGSAAPGGA